MRRRKLHDTAGIPIFTIGDKNGPLDLSDVQSIVYYQKNATSTLAAIPCAALPDQVADIGKCKFATWSPGAVNTKGVFTVELEVTWADGTKSTHPSNREEQLPIAQDVNNA